jgi:hypothetical protein
MKVAHLPALCVLLLSSSLHADVLSEAAQRIDATLEQEFQGWGPKVGLTQLPGPVNDAAFLRRACIDLAGRLPTSAEVQAFVSSDRPDKRIRMADALISEPGAEDVRFQMLAEALRVKDEVGGQSQDRFIQWLRQAVSRDEPLDKVVNALLSATEPVDQNPAAAFLERDGGNDLQTASAATMAFLGIDLHCAHCHDHAFSDVTQRQSHELAAHFAALRGREVHLPKRYLYRNGIPGELVRPRLSELDGTPEPTPHMTLAEWFTSAKNRRFSAMSAYRVWVRLFGLSATTTDLTIGGVDDAVPYYQETPGFLAQNYYKSCFQGFEGRGLQLYEYVGLELPEPANPSSALDVLSQEWRRCGGRVREFQRILVRTRAYHRESFHWHPYASSFLNPSPRVRRLPSEVIWDTLAMNQPSMMPSARLVQVPSREHPLRLFGRGARNWTDESVTPVSHELVRFMMNSPLVESSALAMPNSSVEQLFLTLLARPPSEHEKASASEASQADVAWALLNTSEFMFRP